MPLKPTKADGEVGETFSSSHSPPPRRIEDRFELVCRIYDPRAEEFGLLIFEKLKVLYQPDSLEGRRELGNFRSGWSLVQSVGLGITVLDELWSKAVKEAEVLGRKRKRGGFTKSPEAVWRSIFNKRLDNAKPDVVSAEVAS